MHQQARLFSFGSREEHVKLVLAHTACINCRQGTSNKENLYNCDPRKYTWGVYRSPNSRQENAKVFHYLWGAVLSRLDVLAEVLVCPAGVSQVHNKHPHRRQLVRQGG